MDYAEADPTADVDGYDARAKIAILIAVGLGCQVDPEHIPCRSISSIDRVDFTYARKLDCTIRQISWAERAPGPDRQLFASVRPALVPLSSPLARAQGSQNLVTRAAGIRRRDDVFGIWRGRRSDGGGRRLRPDVDCARRPRRRGASAAGARRAGRGRASTLRPRTMSASP